MCDCEARRCRICGYLQDEPPWSLDGTIPTHNVCPCCGAEAGYEDKDPDTARMYRAKWMEKGGPWWSTIETPPPGFDLEEQFPHIPKNFV